MINNVILGPIPIQYKENGQSSIPNTISIPIEYQLKLLIFAYETWVFECLVIERVWKWIKDFNWYSDILCFCLWKKHFIMKYTLICLKSFNYLIFSNLFKHSYLVLLWYWYCFWKYDQYQYNSDCWYFCQYNTSRIGHLWYQTSLVTFIICLFPMP